MTIKSFFSKIGSEVKSLFSAHSPAAEMVTNALIAALKTAQNLGSNPAVESLVLTLFGNGIGTIALADLQAIIADTLPELEIAQGVEKAISGIADPVLKADTALAYVVANINKLPPQYKGKHWLDVAATLLSKILNITTTAANILINAKLGAIKASE